MLQDIVFAEALSDYKLHLRFEDDVEGTVDIKELIEFKGVFAPFHDPDFFARVKVDEDLGTVCWENSADLDPQVLYAAITGKRLPKLSISHTSTQADQVSTSNLTVQKLLSTIDGLPDDIVQQILNYAESLKHKHDSKQPDDGKHL